MVYTSPLNPFFKCLLILMPIGQLILQSATLLLGFDQVDELDCTKTFN